MILNIKKQGEYNYVDEGHGQVILLLHGLFGALSNWNGVIEKFSKTHRVIIPLMPIYSLPLKKSNVDGLADFITSFVDFLQLNDIILMGNSLGGHVALLYILESPAKVNLLVLTGSSGLFESSMGGTFPKRNDYQYIKKKVEFTFFSPETASKELVDEVFQIINDNAKALRIVSMAKAACRHNLRDAIKNIQNPTLLIWGLNDMITPPEVAHEFNTFIKYSRLYFIDNCGHAPMMEHPVIFNNILSKYLSETHKNN